MKAHEEIMSDAKEVENEDPPTKATPEIKVPRAKIRVASTDRNSASPIRKITIRQSTDSPSRQQSNYEIITPKRDNGKPLENPLMPTVKLHRYDVLAQSPKEKALNNGLDPQALELISANLGTPKAASEYSDKSDESFNMPKISREMKNLQKSTNDSKILSNYLNTSSESPRSRRKMIHSPVTDPLEYMIAEGLRQQEEEIEKDEVENEVETEKEMLESAESDSTLILRPMEPPEKRRKSISRSRSRSRNAMRGRKKSIARQLKDELSVTSDKEEPMEDEDEDMSEMSFITNRSIEGRAVNPPPKPGWDSFCFKCHTDTAVLSLACSKCKCSYHRHCVRPNPIPKNVTSFICPECLEIEMAENSPVNKYGHEKIDLHTLAEMLTIILEKIRTYPDREHFETDIVVKVVKEPSQPLIVTQMSLKTLETRIKTRYYKATEAFIHDIKQLEHNWNIVDRNKSKTLKTVLKYVNTEINELEACVFCYEESFVSGDWFVHPCKRPHLLIWAKLKGYPYWPAKVMSVDARQQVDVRFFGAHDRAWVPAAHCMLFSEKDPNKTKGGTPTTNKNASKTQKGIADAMKEKDDYIENLRARFGFKYSPFRQQFDANELKSQLEAMLPNLKNPKEVKEGSEKELDGLQKEKLTLKIIKGQSSNYQVEHKSSELRPPAVKEKPKLYKVHSKNDDNTKEIDGKLIPLIIKRKSNIEQEVERTKRSRTGSETSESSVSVQSAKVVNISRRKSTREPIKQKKVGKSNLDPPVKKGKHADKSQKDEDELGSVEDVSKMKLIRRRTKSVMPEMDKPLLVPLVIPPGTDEIQMLKEVSPSPPPSVRTKKRSHSYNRSNEKEIEKEFKIIRRQSISISSPIKRSLSSSNKEVTVSRKNSVQKPEEEPEPEPESFNPNLVIKDEPMSDGEGHPDHVEQQNSFTLSDIPNLMQDKSGKKKLIVISTSEENGGEPSSSTAFAPGRAKKTFPNTANQRQIDQLGQQRNWMVCIPQTFPSSTPSNSQPPSNRSTPGSESQISIVQVRSTATSTPNSVLSTSNRALNANPVPPLTFTNSANNQRRNSLHNSNPIFVNGQHRRQSNFGQQPNLPRLAPRPHGVFVNEGTSFSRDNGPVSRMFTDNAHRITDFFRNVLIDTVSAFTPEVPSAENLMLRAENEKLHREMQTTKADCQQKMQELRREHQDEMESIKRAYDERIVNFQIQADQDKSKLIKEVRHQCEIEKQRAIEITRKETKKTTWCSNCTKEARFYCCWNTSYCGQQCQKTHWQHHQKYCTNKNSVGETQQQPQQQQSPMPNSQQTISEQQLMAPVSLSRPTILIRSPHQLQTQPPVQMQLPPPVSVQQHILLPRSLPLIGVCSNQMSPQMTNPIIIAQQPYKNNNRVIQAIFHENPSREVPQTSSLTVQTIPRNDSPNINVISTTPVSEPMIVRANSNAVSNASTPTGQE